MSFRRGTLRGTLEILKFGTLGIPMEILVLSRPQIWFLSKTLKLAFLFGSDDVWTAPFVCLRWTISTFEFLELDMLGVPMEISVRSRPQIWFLGKTLKPYLASVVGSDNVWTAPFVRLGRTISTSRSIEDAYVAHSRSWNSTGLGSQWRSQSGWDLESCLLVKPWNPTKP